jgi:hypothetical protein
MSQLGQNPTWRPDNGMSVLPSEADIVGAVGQVRFVPRVEVASHSPCRRAAVAQPEPHQGLTQDFWGGPNRGPSNRPPWLDVARSLQSVRHPPLKATSRHPQTNSCHQVIRRGGANVRDPNFSKMHLPTDDLLPRLEGPHSQ